MEKIYSSREENAFPVTQNTPESTDITSPLEQEENKKETLTYNIDGTNVEVEYLRFTPETKNGEELGQMKKSVIYFPGWSMPSDAESSEKLVQTLAEETVKDGGCSAFSVTSRAENVSSNSLSTEAMAIAKFVKEKGLEEIVLVGHSKGGQKAANVAVQIQKNHPDINVSGLLLYSPVGLYEQGGVELTTKFWGNALTQRMVTLPDKKLNKAYGSLTRDISGSMIKEIKQLKQNYPKRVISEIVEMAKSDPAFKEIECPVILIQGQDDPVSSPEKTIESISNLETNDFSINKNKHLEKIFPNSPYIRHIVGERLGNHGMAIYRSRAVARVALYLLRRYYRVK